MSTFDERIRQKADQYAERLQRSGLEPSPTLIKALAERGYEEAREEGLKELYEQHERNIDTILREHNKRMNEIKRSGARLRMITCPPIALVFGLVAWYNFNLSATHPGAWHIGVLFAFGAVLFLAMLIGGAMFDRPVPEE